MNTHTFILPSGVEAEVGILKGTHQRIVTEDSDNTVLEKIDELLVTIIVRLGHNINITPKVIAMMPLVDKNYALLQARQFTMDFSTYFKGTYQYKDSEGKPCETEIELNLGENPFEYKPLPVQSKDKSYEGLQTEFEVTLPKSGQKVKFKLYNSASSKVLEKAHNKGKKSAFTAFDMADVQAWDEKLNMWVFYDAEEAHLLDNGYLLDKIKVHQGDLDTTVYIKNPEYAVGSNKPEFIKEDIMSMTSFFFPSQATS